MEQQQGTPADQVLAMAITRVSNAKKELAAAESNLFTVNDQVVAQMVQAEGKQKMDKIESLELQLAETSEIEKPAK